MYVWYIQFIDIFNLYFDDDPAGQIEDISVAVPLSDSGTGKRKSEDEQYKGSGYVPHTLPSTPCPQDESVSPQPTVMDTGMYWLCIFYFYQVF